MEKREEKVAGKSSFSLEQSSRQSTRGEGDTIRAHSLPEMGRIGPLIFGERCLSSSLHPAESTETSLALLSRHLDVYSPRVTCAAPAPLRAREKSWFPPPDPILLEKGWKRKLREEVRVSREADGW